MNDGSERDVGHSVRGSWTLEQWAALEHNVCMSRHRIRRPARKVLQAFSSSFFLVTRFLPASPRRHVETIYAAVRYPDEIVDTFDLTSEAKYLMLDEWERAYERALTTEDCAASLDNGIPWIIADFAEVVQTNRIPSEHYHSFLEAMRRDIEPRDFRNLNDLIGNYIYGSAIVVGYFLAHVYGTSPGTSMEDAYRSAAALGVALQLTNFCRDVQEDQQRGRTYIPADLIRDYGLPRAVTLLAETAEEHYDEAVRTIDVFSANTRPAIRACIDVYRMLNRRILNARGEVHIRHSVPVAAKLAALPASKYWRIPLAYMGAL